MRSLKKHAAYILFIFIQFFGTGIAKDIEFQPNHYKPITKLSDKGQLVDVVPDRFLINQGVLETKIYTLNSPSPYPSISRDIFYGGLSYVQSLSNIVFLGIFFLLIAIFFLIILKLKLTEKSYLPLAKIFLISTISIFASLRLSEGWDELFINLRHTYILLEHGQYSINAKGMYEASVDFFPLLLTTFIAWLGFGPLNAILIVSLIGNVFIIISTFLLVNRITKSQRWSLISSLLIGIYPNVLFIGASGFTAALFSGAILFTAYILLYTEKRILGLILASLLTLIRTEGVLFAFIIIVYLEIMRPRPSIIQLSYLTKRLYKFVFATLVVILPFLISLVGRFYFYNSAIPNPIVFKNTNLDYYYIKNGFKQLGNIFFSHDLYVVFILIIVFWFFIKADLKTQFNKYLRNDLNKLLGLCCVTTLFILPYFVGGGDWFPIFWNRYALPFNLILSLTFLVFVYEFSMTKYTDSFKNSVLVYSGLFIVSCYFIVDQHKPDYFISRAFKVAMQKNGAQLFTGGNWIRIDRFSNLGQFLNKSLPLDATVASGEEATIMYFSKREMIGLLGVSNTEIASMPLQPLSPGDINHRKRAYASIYHLRPDVIALNDPDLLGDFGRQIDRFQKVHEALQDNLFGQYYVDKNYYLVGSFDALKKMGYSHLTLVFEDRIFSLFIHARIYEQFISNIESEGFLFSSLDFINYNVNPNITKRFMPAVPDLLNSL